MNEFDTTTDFMPIEEFLSRNPDYASATSQMDVVAFPQNVIISSSWLRQKYGKKWTEYARLYKDSGYHVWLKSPDLRDLNDESLRRDGFTLYDPIEFVKKKGYLTDEEVPSIFAEHSLKTLPQPSKPNVIGEFALKTGEFVSGTYENIKQGVESFYHGTPYAKLFGFYGMMDLLSHPEEIEPYLKYSNAKAKKTFTDAWKLTNTVALAYSSPITFLKNTITTSKVDFPIKEDPSFQVLKSEMHELTQDLLPVVKGASALTNILWSPAIATFDSIDNAIGIATNRLTNPSFAREHPSWYNFLQRPTGEIFGLFTGAITKSLTTVGVHEEVAQDLGGIASAWLMGKVIDSIGGKAKLLPKMLKKEKVREPIKEFKEAPEEIQVPEVDMLPEEERIAEITDEDIRRYQEKKQKIGELAETLKKVADRKYAKELSEQPTTEMEFLNDVYGETREETSSVAKDFTPDELEILQEWERKGKIKPIKDILNEAEKKKLKAELQKIEQPVSDLIIEGKTDEAIELLDKKRETLELDLAKMDIPKKNKDVLLHIYNNFTEFLKQKLKEYKENGLFEKYNNISPNYFAKFNSVINVLRDTLDKTDRFINEINQIQVDKKGDKLDIITPTSELTPETKGAIADKLFSHAVDRVTEMVEKGDLSKEESNILLTDVKSVLKDAFTKDYTNNKTIGEALDYVRESLKTFTLPAIEISKKENGEYTFSFHVPQSLLYKLSHEESPQKRNAIIRDIAKHEASHIILEQLPEDVKDKLYELFNIKKGHIEDLTNAFAEVLSLKKEDVKVKSKTKKETAQLVRTIFTETLENIEGRNTTPRATKKIKKIPKPNYEYFINDGKGNIEEVKGRKYKFEYMGGTFFTVKRDGKWRVYEKTTGLLASPFTYETKNQAIYDAKVVLDSYIQDTPLDEIIKEAEKKYYLAEELSPQKEETPSSTQKEQYGRKEKQPQVNIDKKALESTTHLSERQNELAKFNMENFSLSLHKEGKNFVFRFKEDTALDEGMLEPITYEQIKNSGEVIWHVSEEERGRTTKGRLRTLRYATGKMLANIHKDLARAIEEEEIKPVPENMPLVYGVYNNKTGEVRLVADKKLPMAKLLTNKNEIKKLNSELAKIWTKYKGKDKDEKYVGVYRYRVIKTYSNLPVAIAELTGFEKPAKKFKTYQAIAKAVGSYHRFFFSTSQKEVDAYVDKIKQDLKDGKYPEDYDLILMTAIPRTGRGKVRDIGYIVAPSMQEAGKLLKQYPFKTALGEKGFAIDRIVLRSEHAIKTVGEVIKADEKQQEPLLHNVVNKLEGDEDANTVAHYIGEKPSKYMPQLVESVIENMKVVKDKITGMPRTLPSKISALVETVDEEVKRRREYFRTSKIGQAIKKTLTPNQRATLLWGMVNPVTEYGRILSEKAFKSALIKDWLNKKVLSKIPKLKSESLGYLAMIMSEPETKERITEMISLKKEQSELFRQANTIIHNIYERANITRTVLENALEILDAKHGESIEALKKYFPDMKDSEYSKMRTRLYEIIDKVEDVNKKIEASNVWWNEFLGNLLDTQITLAKTDDNIGVFLLAGIDTERLTGDMKEAYGEFLQSERAQELLDRYGKEIQYIKEYMAHAKHEMQISGIHTREGDYLPYFLPDVFFKDAKLGHRNAPYVSDWFARHMPIPLYPDLHQALMKYVDLHRTKVDFSDFIWKWRQRIAEIKDHDERAYWKNWMDTNIAPERLGSIEKFVNNVKNFMAMKLLLASFSAALKHMVKFTLSFQAHGIKGMSYGVKEFAKGVFGKGGIAEVFWKEGAKDKIKDFLDKHNNIITKVVDNKLLTDNPKERKTLIELYDKLNPNAKLLMQFLTEREALRSLTERIDDWDTMIRTGAVGDTKFVADILEKVGIDRKESVVIYNEVKNKGKKFINEVAKRLSFVSYVELVENGINVFATMHSLAKTGKVDAYDVLQFKDAIMNSILLHNFRGGYDSWLAVKNPYIGAMTLFQTTPTKIFLHSAYSLLDSYLDLKTEGVTPFFNKAVHDPYSMGRQLFRLMFVGGLLLYTVDKKFKTHFIVDLLPIPFTTDWVFGKGAFMNKGIYISPMFQVIWSANEKGIGKALKRELTYWGGLTKLARIIEGDIPKIYEGDAVRYLFSMPKEFPAQKKKKGRHKQYHMNMKEPEMIDFSKTTIGGLEYVDFSKPLK